MAENLKRTDLALEAREIAMGEAPGQSGEPDGVKCDEYEKNGYPVTRVEVLDERGEAAIGKPRGVYITIELHDLIRREQDAFPRGAKTIAHELRELVPRSGTVLVAGLGNRGITPDALGPETVEQLNVTRHLVRTYGKKGREVSALAPGVMAQTGMEAVEILRGTAEQTHPDVILAVDALAACSIHRLNCTIQLADTGIWPGSGVGNHRNALNQETLGVPVIGIGVPTVVGAGTIVHDAVAGVLESLEESEMDEFLGEVISPALESLYVTTKEIDEMVRRLAGVLAAGMNQAFSGEM